jgi:hypothetical protein
MVAVRLLVLMLLLMALAPLWAERACVSPEEALAHAEKDVCVAAHVYDVVETSGGVRFLDMCSPDVPDTACRFTVMSLPEDQKEVGALEGYRGRDVRVRGVVHVARGQATILLSHARQFQDGAEKFRPNPALLGGFDAGSAKTAFRDPAMTAHKSRGQSRFLGTGAR